MKEKYISLDCDCKCSSIILLIVFRSFLFIFAIKSVKITSKYKISLRLFLMVNQ